MPKPKSETGFQFTIFGLASAAASSFSLFSLSQSILSFGVGPILSDLLTYYRTLGAWVIGSVGALFGWTFPVWLIDLWILSGLASAAFVRAASGQWADEKRRKAAGEPERSTLNKSLVDVFRWLLFTVTFIGLINLILSIFPVLFGFFGRSGLGNDNSDRIFRRQFFHFLIIIAGLGAFFAMNAYGPAV